MITLFAALASSRDHIDRAIAFGEAVPRLERIKAIAFAGLVLACFILTLAYINTHDQIATIRAQQVKAEVERAAIMEAQRDGDADRAAIMDLLTGKQRASLTSTP